MNYNQLNSSAGQPTTIPPQTINTAAAIAAVLAQENLDIASAAGAARAAYITAKAAGGAVYGQSASAAYAAAVGQLVNFVSTFQSTVDAAWADPTFNHYGTADEYDFAAMWYLANGRGIYPPLDQAIDAYMAAANNWVGWINGWNANPGA